MESAERAGSSKRSGQPVYLRAVVVEALVLRGKQLPGRAPGKEVAALDEVGLIAIALFQQGIERRAPDSSWRSAL
ncbi:hypothetical protein ACSZOJ_09740 [Aeromonas dhakensis]